VLIDSDDGYDLGEQAGETTFGKKTGLRICGETRTRRLLPSRIFSTVVYLMMSAKRQQKTDIESFAVIFISYITYIMVSQKKNIKFYLSSLNYVSHTTLFTKEWQDTKYIYKCYCFSKKCATFIFAITCCMLPHSTLQTLYSYAFKFCKVVQQQT